MRKTTMDQQGSEQALAVILDEREESWPLDGQSSWRQRAWVGYLISIAVVGLAFVGMLLGQRVLPHFSFVEAPMFLTVLVMASVWGTGPALFAVLLSSLLLDYFTLPPLRAFSLYTGEGLLQLLPFLLAGVFIAMMISRWKQARRQARRAEREMLIYIDELSQINAQLQEADRLKSQFLSMVSHELKTPMTTILARTQLLQRRLSKRPELLSDADEVCKDLEKIEQQTSRMNALVDDLLDWSRMCSGKMELCLSPCDLGAICHSLIEDQQLVSGRMIELELPLAPVLLQADRHRLSQVMTNLVSNALKYSPDNTTVHIDISQNEHEAMIRITDAGPGIPEQQRSRIFELFYRTPQARESSQSGFGLGLAICKEIVERHGGRIWCESAVGQGSTFIVQLPLK